MFAFLVDGNAKVASDVFTKGTPSSPVQAVPKVRISAVERRQIAKQVREQHELEEEEEQKRQLELVALMKNNDGAWMEKMAAEYNSDSDSSEGDSAVSDDSNDRGGDRKLDSEGESSSSDIEDSGDSQSENNDDDEKVNPTEASSTSTKTGPKESGVAEKNESIAERHYPEDRTIFANDLSFDTTEETLTAHLTQDGIELERVSMERNNSGRSAGFAYVVLAHAKDVETIVKLHHTMLDGRK
eukprot:Stramenopile-MAST_4_protein_6224